MADNSSSVTAPSTGATSQPQFDIDRWLNTPSGGSPGFDIDAYLKGQPQEPMAPDGWVPTVAHALQVATYYTSKAIAQKQDEQLQKIAHGFHLNQEFSTGPLDIAVKLSNAELEAKRTGTSFIKQALGNQWTAANTPLLSAPDVDTSKLPDLPFLGGSNPRILGHLWNATHGTIEGFESPAALATVGVGGGLAQSAKAGSALAANSLRAMSGAFSAISAYAFAHAAPDTWKLLHDPNVPVDDKAKAVVGETANAAMTLLGALGTIHKIAPEVAKELPGTHIEDVPGKVVAAAGEIADPEAQAAVVQAANHIAEVTGQPPIEVKSPTLEPPTLPAKPLESTAEPTAVKATPESPSAETPPPPDESKLPPADTTFGIAARVTDARAEAGIVDPIESGQGIAPEASVARGRQLLDEGVSPEDALARFEKTGAIKADDVALVRAKGEQLAKAASDAAVKYGTKSPEYEAAAKADSEWIRAIKPMQTEWSKIGAAQQGETDLNTGDFHSLRTKFQELAGRDFTDREAVQAEKIAQGVRDNEADVQTAKEQVVKEVEKQAAKATEQEPGSVGDVWQRAKDLLEKGTDDFDDLRHKIATDTGLPVDEVTKILAGPKKLRVITNDMYSKMAQRRHLVAQANYWLRQQAMPGWERFIKAVPGAFFRAKVFGHGTVGMVTHAGINVFDPTSWANYWPAFMKQYKLLGWHDQGAFHERAMQDLAREPNYVTARRAGLANSATRAMDDYQRGFMGKIGLSGNRGFDALKIFRQAQFSQAWDKLPTDMKTPEYARALADSINHSTGYVRANFPKLANSVIFAPKLEGSRWAFLVGDPVKDGKTFLNWSNATPAERAMAVRNVKQKAIMVGTYASLLAINEGLLEATNSDEKINYDDPRKPDFLAFKGAGHQFGVVSPLLGSIRYVANMMHAAMGERTKTERKDTRFEEMTTLSAKYVRGKASPFGAFAADVATQADFQGRPLPFSNDKVPAYLRREGKGPYTVPEYAMRTIAPIPLEEALKEVWMDQGMSEDRAKHWLGVLATIAVVGGTGARLQPDTALEGKHSPTDRFHK